MGVSAQQIAIAKKFGDAKALIDEKKPKLLVTEYDIEDSLGLTLIEAQEKFYNETSRIAIVVTKNSSDSAVAEAAEEQVDGFLLKPFSIDTFQKRLLAAVQRKLSPSPYAQKIRSGKQKLEAQEFTSAYEEFVHAKSLDQKPTLACFYTGKTLKNQGRASAALLEFQEGRKIHPMHYKCLTGEFECLFDEKRYQEAYELVHIIRGNFPITSHRLGQFIFSAILTSRFEDLPLYYEIFQKFEHRPPALIRLTSQAFLAAGKIAARKSDLPKAFEYFSYGVNATGRDFDFIETVIPELLKYKAVDEAQSLFSKIKQDEMGSARWTRLSYRIDEFVLPVDQLIEKGRKIVMAGEGTPEIFQSLVQRLVEARKLTLAETIVGVAVSSHPELRKTLYQIIESGQADSKAS